MSEAPVIVGGGPAGLTAGYELVRHGLRPLVLEKGARVGGLARTEVYKGYRFDIGGHRFYTKVPEVQRLWEEVLGADLLKVRRTSRIFYNGRFFDYPLSLRNVVRNLGALESLRVVASYCKARLRRAGPEETFEQWVVNRFGERLYRTFFKTYTEKVWGVPCTAIRADWAAQRIKGLSLASAVANAFRKGDVKSLIEEFYYPRLGPGQMWERLQEEVEAGGGRVRLHAAALAFRHDGRRVRSVRVGHGGGAEEVAGGQFITSLPLSDLVRRLDPPPPEEVLAAAGGLKYRDFLVVTLIIDRPELFPDNWVYVHSPDVRVGRIQNFKNWSKDLVPDPARTSVGMEYFCNRGDDLWRADDAALVELAGRELERLGLARAADVRDGCVIRQPKAYPVYDADYGRHLAVLRGYLGWFANLQTVGRNGMHRYNNQDHSMLCGLYAARNLLGGRHDLWEVNTERSYYEEQQLSRAGRAPARGTRPGPSRAPRAAAPADEAGAARP